MSRPPLSRSLGLRLVGLWLAGFRLLGLGLIGAACTRLPASPASPTTEPPAHDLSSATTDRVSVSVPDQEDELGAPPAPTFAESPDTTPKTAAPERRHPLASLDEAELERAVRDDLESLGPISIGAPNAGALLNAVQFPESKYFISVDPHHNWGTSETIRFLLDSARKVHEQFPETPPLYLGHISGRRGGHLRPHLSHQAGRDADIGYYYKTAEHWYTRATSRNLDVPRTWAFVRALITETDVEMILIDHSIQRLLRDYAASIGENAEWLEEVFQGKRGQRPPLIRHFKGHQTHLHVRFYNPIAQETARRTYRFLVKHHEIKPPTYFVNHKVKKGETLGRLAKRYGTSVRAIQKSNNLKGTLIRASRVYRIPQTGGPRMPSSPVHIPPRRLPPPPASPADAPHRDDAEHRAAPKACAKC